jgi:hypothetical protein
MAQENPEFNTLTPQEFLEQANTFRNRIVEIEDKFSLTDLQTLASNFIGNINLLFDNDGNAFGVQFIDEEDFDQVNNQFFLNEVGEVVANTKLILSKDFAELPLKFLDHTAEESTYYFFMKDSIWEILPSSDLEKLQENSMVTKNLDLAIKEEMGIDAVFQIISNRLDELNTIIMNFKISKRIYENAPSQMYHENNLLDIDRELSLEAKKGIIKLYFSLNSDLFIESIQDLIGDSSLAGKKISTILRGKEDQVLVKLKHVVSKSQFKDKADDYISAIDIKLKPFEEELNLITSYYKFIVEHSFLTEEHIAYLVGNHLEKIETYISNMPYNLKKHLYVTTLRSKLKDIANQGGNHFLRPVDPQTLVKQLGLINS